MCKRLVFLLCLGLGFLAFTSAMAFGQTMYDIQIAGGTDDAEEHLNAGMDITSSDLEIPYEDSGTPATDEQLIGMRWIVPIAKDFVVGKAYVEFELKETKGSTNTVPVNVIIEGQLLANAPAFTTAAKDITNRTRTQAQVKWTIPTGMAVGARFQTPDISSIIKEIINQDGWASGNALVIILRDDKSAPSTGLRCVHSYDGNVAGAPLLHIQPPWPWAINPEPADGAIGVSQPLVKWTPGEGAVLHNVYFGTSPELTEANLVAKNQLVAMYYHAPGFEPGVQYYWRIDELDAAGKVSTGPVWTFTIPSQKAYAPVPRNGGKYVPTDVTLAWAAGAGGGLHTVYFGNSFDDVNNAGGGAPQSGLTYAPDGPLAASTTYYWRVDESDGITTHKGNVWSFTTMPDITIADPNLIGWWTFDEGVGNKAVDFSGHGNDGTFGGSVKWVEGFVGSAVQLSNGYVAIDGVVDDIKSTNITLSAWIKTTQTNEGNVFAANDSASAHPVMFGVSGGNAYVTDGAATEYPPTVNDNEWHMITYVRSGSTGTIYADGIQVGTYAAAFDLSSVTRWSIGQEWDDATASNFYIGAVDDARFYAKALTPDEIKELMRGDLALAWKPSPEDGATMDIIRAEQGVTWSPGDDAAQHNVYFGTNQAAVEAANASDTTGVYRGRQEQAGYAPTEELAWGTGPYYWRIDEVQADGTITTGAVWSFTVANFLSVDDFESYNDEADMGTRIYETWIDGQTNDTTSTVGNWDPPFAERTIIHGGTQSMPVDYNNINSPYYAEAEREFDPVQNWKLNDVTDLTLFVRGNAAGLVENPAGQYTISANSGDVWDTADSFRFVYKTLNGDGAISAKVLSVTNTNVWAKAGVMIRESLSADSSYAFMFPTPDGRRAFQNRPSPGGSAFSAHSATGQATLPFWVKVERKGNQLTAYYSTDGKNWTVQPDTENTGTDASPNPQTIFMTGSVRIGLGVASNNSQGGTCFGTFSDVVTSGSVSGQFQVADIGSINPGNDPATLYVAVEDSSGKVAVVSNPDAGLVNVLQWTEWKIPLSDLAGVNLSKVKKLYVGVGDRENPVVDGSGRIYIDDIRMTKP